jgi:hypothetical protein
MSRKPDPSNDVEVPNEIGETVVDLTGAPSAHPDDMARSERETEIPFVDLTDRS